MRRSPKVEWNANLSAAPGAADTQKPVDAYREIVARPAFFKSRQPYVAPLPPPPVAVAPPPAPVAIDPGLAISGVMIRDGLRTAYVLSGGNNGTWVKEGEAYLGWKVMAVSKSGARLEQAGRSIDLMLYPEK